MLNPPTLQHIGNSLVVNGMLNIHCHDFLGRKFR